MTYDYGAVGTQHINIFVAVHIGYPSAFCMIEIYRVLAGYKVVRTANTCYSPGYYLQGVFIHFFGNFQFQFL